MKNQKVFHFEGIEGNPEFQIKCDLGRDKNGTFELPCRCRFLIPDGKAQYFEAFFHLLADIYRKSEVRLEDSLWREANFEKAKHIFCDKDPDQEMRLSELLLQRRAILNDASGLVKLDHTTNIADIPESHIIESAFFYLQLKDMFSKTLRNPRKPKKGGQLPNSVKKTLQEANKRTEKGLTDDQLAELFKADSHGTKKSVKKTLKRKPNKGKVPNNIRKTKKPAKL